MPAENPPQIYRTEDNQEWKFVQTFAEHEHDQMQQFRRKSQCHFITGTGRENNWRFRLSCNLRNYRNCEFQMLALKTTSGGYHVYTFGQHNHPVKPNGKCEENFMH
jgi:hypothetical protein